jgi:hypothetical protein
VSEVEYRISIDRLAHVLTQFAPGEGQAVDAVFALSVVALYVAYGIPIGARLVGRLGWRRDQMMGAKNLGGDELEAVTKDKNVSERVWMDGPFHLGAFVSLYPRMTSPHCQTYAIPSQPPSPSPPSFSSPPSPSSSSSPPLPLPPSKT